MKKVVVSLSGGMDSSTLLLNLLANEFEVKAICFDYGQKHNVETQRAKELWTYLEHKGLVKIEDFKFIKLPLESLLHSTLIRGGEEVPEGHYEEATMKDTVVPNRNKIFSSIIQAVALSWANETESPVSIAMGIHAGDHSLYPDTTREFRDADYAAFEEGNWNSEMVTYYTPYIYFTKGEVLRDGLDVCDTLGLDFNEVYSKTITSYKPIRITTKFELSNASLMQNNEIELGVKGEFHWYSDYKSSSSVERIEAFIELGRKDPLYYADLENGPVEWEVARNYVQQLIKHRDENSNK